jgi:hypothetical protein
MNYFRLRLKQPRAAGQSLSALNGNTTSQFLQGFERWNFFHLRPILTLVGVARMQQALVQRRFIAQQQQTFRIRVEPSDGINIIWKAKLGERAVRRVVIREL